MDTAGKAVLFSGVTVLISLSAVMLVPSPAFRSMALGIMLSVVFVLAATLTLLPAVLAKLGPRVDALPAALGALRRAPLGALRALGRAALAPPARLRACGDARPRPARAAGLRAEDRDAVDQGRARHSDSSRVGYTQVQQAFGAGAPGALQIVAPAREAPRRSCRSRAATPASPASRRRSRAATGSP